MGIEYGAIGQSFARLMVVGDQHLKAEFVLRILDLVDRGDAAVHADQKMRVALVRNLFERGFGDAVAVLAAVGNEKFDVRASRLEIEQKYGRGANAVAIVVAEDDDSLPLCDCALQPVGDFINAVISIERRKRVRRRVQKRARGRLVAYPSLDEKPGDERMYIQLSCERSCVHKSKRAA